MVLNLAPQFCLIWIHHCQLCPAGSTDTYYRSSGGKRFRSIRAALEHMGKPPESKGKTPKKGPAANSSPDKPDRQKPSIPFRHHTSKLIIKGSMLRADNASGQTSAAETKDVRVFPSTPSSVANHSLVPGQGCVSSAYLLQALWNDH